MGFSQLILCGSCTGMFARSMASLIITIKVIGNESAIKKAPDAHIRIYFRSSVHIFVFPYMFIRSCNIGKERCIMPCGCVAEHADNMPSCTHPFLEACEQAFFWQARLGQFGIEICIGMITEGDQNSRRKPFFFQP